MVSTKIDVLLGLDSIKTHKMVYIYTLFTASDDDGFKKLYGQLELNFTVKSTFTVAMFDLSAKCGSGRERWEEVH